MTKSVNKKLQNAMRREYRNSPNRILNQLKAFRAGKNVVVTIENPNKEETNKRFIKVNGKDFFKMMLKPGSNRKNRDEDEE